MPQTQQNNPPALTKNPPAAEPLKTRMVRTVPEKIKENSRAPKPATQPLKHKEPTPLKKDPRKNKLNEESDQSEKPVKKQ
jgi:hypothetical protein